MLRCMFANSHVFQQLPDLGKLAGEGKPALVGLHGCDSAVVERAVSQLRGTAGTAGVKVCEIVLHISALTGRTLRMACHTEWNGL